MSVLIAMMATALLSAVGLALTLLTITETAIAANARQGIEAFYGAEAAVAYALQEVAAEPDWADVVEGRVPSRLSDGAPDGTRTVGGTTLDFARAFDEVTADKALWGDAYIAWTLYAWGWIAQVLPGTLSGTGRAPLYALVWVGDASEDRTAYPDVKILAVRGYAYGPRGSRRAVEVRVTREKSSAEQPSAPLRVLSWRELR